MQTSITKTFKDGTVLITGSTGFLGKILMEKLLRSCSIKNIAILVRNKKGLTADQRIASIFKQTIFDRLRREKPEFMNSIKVIDGNLDDLSKSISAADRDWLIENVHFVFHCAATIKFNESLEMASKINIQGTENILALATDMKSIKGFVHVSTAYSHCPRNEIKEQFYPVPVTAKELKHLLDLKKPTLDVQGNWPNTYAFTKAITENMISTNEYHLPISIFRPSIVGCTVSEPDPGWMENMNGPSGIVTGVSIGFLRAIPIDTNKVADIIPVDYTVNALISVMWDTVNRYQNSTERLKEPKIYNYVSSVEKPITWGRYITEMHDHYTVAPVLRSIWYPFFIFHTSLWFGTILRFFFHWIPAVIVDSFLLLSGKNTKMLKMYVKTENMMDLLYEFTTRQWTFDNSNTRELWASLNQEDRSTFWYSLEDFDWKTYIKSYYYGIREHILHEDSSSIGKALTKHQKLFWLHHLCLVFIIYLVFKIICWMFCFVLY